MHTAYVRKTGGRTREVGTMRLLADRGTGGISVRMFWDEAAAAGADIFIEYEDRMEGVIYMLQPPSDRALDAFYHPNAYLPLEREQAA
jgi:hypothetical protein